MRLWNDVTCSCWKSSGVTATSLIGGARCYHGNVYHNNINLSVTIEWCLHYVYHRGTLICFSDMLSIFRYEQKRAAGWKSLQQGSTQEKAQWTGIIHIRYLWISFPGFWTFYILIIELLFYVIHVLHAREVQKGSVVKTGFDFNQNWFKNFVLCFTFLYL